MVTYVENLNWTVWPGKEVAYLVPSTTLGRTSLSLSTWYCRMFLRSAVEGVLVRALKAASVGARTVPLNGFLGSVTALMRPVAVRAFRSSAWLLE